MYNEKKKGVFAMTTFLGNPVTFTGHQVRDTAYDSSLTTLNFEKKMIWEERYLSPKILHLPI